MSSTPFGEHLKREREMRGVSLDEVAAATRINTRFLEALENGQWDQLPGGAFNRGFIRATARFLGLNEDSMVAEYALETKGELDNRPPDPGAMPMPRDLRPLGFAIGAVLVLIIALGYGFHRYHVARVKKQQAALAAAEAANSTAPTPPNAANSSTVAPDSTVPAAGPATSNPAKTETPAPVANAPEVLKLKLEDGKGAKIKVIGDGKKLFEGHLRARSAKDFQAREGFEVTSDELSTLSIELNGQDVPVPSGASGKAISITRKDLKPADGSH